MSDLGWVIVYIRGREGFQEEVLPKLRDKYLSGNSDNAMMIWIQDVEKLRSLKLAVGTRAIFKYRLHFYTSPHAHHMSRKKPSFGLLTLENEFVNPMIVW